MDRVLFDYSKLKGRIKEKCGSQKAFAGRLGTTPSSISMKLNGSQYFSQKDIMKTARILEIQPEDIFAYFFAPKVQKVEH